MDKTLQTNSAELLPSQATFSFDLPVDSDALYFLSRGSLASGSVKVGVGIEGGDKVAVDVVVSYWSSSALERTTVCELQRTDGQHGIGIFVRDPISTPQPDIYEDRIFRRPETGMAVPS